MNRNVQCVSPAAAGLASLLSFAATARVDEGGHAAHGLMVEIGSAGEWPRNSDGANLRVSMAAEVMPIEIGLEPDIGRWTLTAAPNSELSGGRAVALADLQCSGTGLIAECGACGRFEVIAGERPRQVHRADLKRVAVNSRQFAASPAVSRPDSRRARAPRNRVWRRS